MNILFKNTRPGGQLIALFLIAIVFFIIGTGVTLLPLLFGFDVTNLLSQALSQVVIFAGSALFFSYLFHGSPSAYLRLVTPSGGKRHFVYVIPVLLLILPASDWLTTVNEAWHLPSSLATLEEFLRQQGELSQQILMSFLLRDGVGDLFLNLLVLAIVPALCEELFFRGALQQTLEKCFKGNHHLAVWLTAAIFSLMHGDFFAFLPRFLLGLLLGYLFYYSRSLWVNALAHFVNNALAVLLYFLAAHSVISIDDAESFGLPFVVVALSFAACVSLFWLLFVRKQPVQ